MHYSRPLSGSFFLLIVIFFSCKKDHTPPPPPVIVYDSQHISLNFPASQIYQQSNPYPSYSSYELIISETGGRVVLDTITSFNAPVVTWLKTNQSLLDVTTVRNWATTGAYLIHSYKAIDLSGWVNIPDNDSAQPLSGGTTLPPPVTGLMTYAHVNVPYGSYYNVLAGGRADVRQSNGTAFMWGGYNASPGDYAYLIFPTLGLFNVHRIVGSTDTVDLSRPDTCATVTFNRSSLYKTSGFTIAGYPDSTDLLHTVQLTYYSALGAAINDAGNMVYPGKKSFQKYTFSYFVSDGVNNNYASVNLPFVDRIPDVVSAPDPSWYTISLSSDTVVTTNFTGHTPTYYNVTTHMGSNQFTLTVRGDSTLVRPVDFYASLNSKWLAGQNYHTMVMDNIYLLTDEEPDYQIYWKKHTSIYKEFTPGSANMTYQRHF
jgi:hypothetical protein